MKNKQIVVSDDRAKICPELTPGRSKDLESSWSIEKLRA